MGVGPTSQVWVPSPLPQASAPSRYCSAFTGWICSSWTSGCDFPPAPPQSPQECSQWPVQEPPPPPLREGGGSK